MPDIFIPILIVAILVALILVFAAAQFLMLYVQAMLSGAPVSLFELLGMRLRKVDLRTIVFSRIRAVRAGMDIPTSALETHYLAGGRVPNVISAMIAAQKARIPLDWDRATAIDLAGRDILDAVQSAINPIEHDLPPRSEPPLRAAAKDGIPLEIRAKVALAVNIGRLVGGATEEMLMERLATAIINTIALAPSHEPFLADPRALGESLVQQQLERGTAFDIVALDLNIRRDFR